MLQSVSRGWGVPQNFLARESYAATALRRTRGGSAQAPSPALGGRPEEGPRAVSRIVEQPRGAPGRRWEVADPSMSQSAARTGPDVRKT